jgi:hypothetical protein
MREFQIVIHARGEDASSAAEVEIDGEQYQTLRARAASDQPFAITFEQAAAALDKLPRMFIEPDGAFVWVASREEASWQVDGVLYDRDDRLLLVDLKGSCPPEQFDQLLRALGWPATPLMFQLVQHAVYVDEAECRRFMQRKH